MAREFTVTTLRKPPGEDFGGWDGSSIQERKIQRIEDVIARTAQKGRLPLWEGYAALAGTGYGRNVSEGAKRSINDVRSNKAICRFYAWLVTRKRPEAILEFGAAFGASGMYWLAGLEETGTGSLHSFEPNEGWCAIARENFATVSDRFTLTCGTFEDGIALVPQGIGIAMIDAIHTRAFVDRQFALVRTVAAPGALVVFDDINFNDDMRACWAAISASPEWAGVWELGRRAGMIQLPG
jgi:hypothetical protein